MKATGRKQLVLAALYTEICLAMPALQALADGYDVFVVTDASGGVTAEAHDMAVRRMVAAGDLISTGVRRGRWPPPARVRRDVLIRSVDAERG